jgi:transcriptional regulator with XRE-family HTH domain
MDKEISLVKRTCKELGITQKELAEIMGVTPHTVTNWAKGKMEAIHEKALSGLIYEKKYNDIQVRLKGMIEI